MRSAQFLTIGVCLFGSTALAQPTPAPLDLKAGNLDLAVPEAPAFTVLDLTPESVVRPATPREAAISLLNGVDRDGNLQTGLAVDTAPYLIARANGPNPMTLADYRANYGQRVLARLGVSLATVKGSDDADESVRVALGFRAVPLDYGDPRNDPELLKCLLKVQKAALAVISDDAPWQSPVLEDMFGVKMSAMRDSTAEQRRKKIEAKKDVAVSWVVWDACRSRSLQKEVLKALQVTSEDQAFALIGSNSETFCLLSETAREAKLASKPSAKALVDEAEADINWLCLPGPPRETGFSTNAEVFATLDIDPAKVCSAKQEDILAALEGNPEMEEVGTRLVQILEQHVESTLVPALAIAAAAGDRCREEARARNWNATAWEIGGAPVWMSDDGKVQGLTSQGGAVWTSLSIDFAQVPILNSILSKEATDYSQGILHLRYQIDEQVPDPGQVGEFFAQNELLVGGRLRVGWDRFAASLEGVYVYADPDDRPSSSGARYSLGADLRIASNLWLTASVGGQSGQDDGDQAFVLGSFKYGFSGERTIPIGPE